MSKVIMYTDGGARNNPGPAAAGVVIINGDTVVAEVKQYLGSQTNNWAEYEAVAIALIEAQRLGFAGRAVEVRLDSKLVAEQISGNWKIKEPALKLQWIKVRAMMAAHFPGIIFKYIPREQNKEADRLVNEALDEAGH